MTQTYSMVIGGASVAAQSTFEVRNPSNGELVGLAPEATVADLDKAVAAADTAFQTWSQQSDDDLRAACEAVTAKIVENSDELAKLITCLLYTSPSPRDA